MLIGLIASLSCFYCKTGKRYRISFALLFMRKDCPWRNTGCISFNQARRSRVIWVRCAAGISFDYREYPSRVVSNSTAGPQYSYVSAISANFLDVRVMSKKSRELPCKQFTWFLTSLGYPAKSWMCVNRT